MLNILVVIGILGNQGGVGEGKRVTVYHEDVLVGDELTDNLSEARFELTTTGIHDIRIEMPPSFFYHWVCRDQFFPFNETFERVVIRCQRMFRLPWIRR